MRFICSSGSSRQRRNATSKSADSRASRPGMLSLICGLIVPSAGSMAKRTVHLKPWRESIRATIGIDSSDRYDSSAAMKTMCFPCPAPSPPGYTTHGSVVTPGAGLALAGSGLSCATHKVTAENRMAARRMRWFMGRDDREWLARGNARLGPGGELRNNGWTRMDTDEEGR